MSTSVPTASDAKQHAIDLRLDAIDRALLGLLPRQQRIELVAKIEAKIREAAAAVPTVNARQERTELDRLEQSLAVIDAADRSTMSSARDASFGRRRSRSHLAVSSGVLGMLALALLLSLPIAFYILAAMGDELLGTLLLGIHAAAAALGGLLAIALGIAALVILKRRGRRLIGYGWAITGLCTAPLPIFVGGIVALVIGAGLVINGGTTSPVYTASAPPPYSQAPGYPVPVTPAAPGSYPASAPASPYDSAPTVSAYAPAAQLNAPDSSYSAAPSPATLAPPVYPSAGVPPEEYPPGAAPTAEKAEEAGTR